ncbi:PREDICTED: uncharacterized protein LOC108373024 [Rhagoletis zephyria]|uniref:uncharacterized protein LOC108373024 n=2 Tax=Rhagoletis TaxID=28609 RepID=UPI0008118977|nr:PREDICTED: uncharacterized protein LOC108373024 [Rhagoletis zephyria]XP_017484351.1 PREDICTED: uncharacterized protein LOC108373024 [Rhagoletis zephyria]XP_017484352.1 PREDICTED: uncharacterized protein LOC108373024 [Rhagoletis zephyria]XP_017484353.1 PREDICTED: uncharacterized protein LOC108373024 [Rhagoletis zephyria]
MGSRSSPRIVNRSASHHYRLSDGIHKVPSSVTIWPCEMTDMSPTGFLLNNQHQHQHQTHQQYGGYSTSSGLHSSSHSHSSSSTTRAPPIGSGGGGVGGRLFPYFGGEHERERKKSETSFFNLGFRRKSTVVYYASTD